MGIDGYNTPGDAGKEAKTFGVVISLPRKVARVIVAARKSTGELTDSDVPPHIALITRARSADEERVKSFVARVAAEVEPFDLSLHGGASFLPVTKVAFMPVAQGAPQVFKLHKLLWENSWKCEEKLDFIPHVTLGQDVPKKNIDRVVEEFKDKNFTFYVERIDLFGLMGESWEKRGEYVLGQVQKKTPSS